MKDKTFVVAGIDGGGSSTRASIVNEKGVILGEAKAGPSSYSSVSLETLKDNIQKALDEALRSANTLCTGEVKLDAIFIGLGGVETAQDKETVRNLVSEFSIVDKGQIFVENDTRVSLAGGLAGRAGLSLIVGTGSVCYGRTEDGREWKAGGWGHLIDDPGSGYYLGLNGLIAMVRAVDGRGIASPLTEALFRHLQLKEINEIMYILYQKKFTRTDVAALAPIILEYAAKGDKIGKMIIQRGAEELALMIKTVVDKLELGRSSILLAMTGGLTQAGGVFNKPLYEEIEKRVPNIEIIQPILSPLSGASLLALKKVGMQITAEIIDNLKKSVI